MKNYYRVKVNVPHYAHILADDMNDLHEKVKRLHKDGIVEKIEKIEEFSEK